MKEKPLKEPQSQRCLDLRANKGLTPLGLHTNQTWHDDPKRLVFTLSRYKFVAKMLAGRRNVLEIGCGDAFATQLVQNEVKRLTAIDFEPQFVQDIKARMEEHRQFDCFVHDITKMPVKGSFDAAYALDVLEHISPDKERLFMRNIHHSLTAESALIIGMPSLQSQRFASEISRQGHVNCKDGEELKQFLEQYFFNVFIFSMNDEVVHTGFYKSAHYLLALCCSKRHLKIVHD